MIINYSVKISILPENFLLKTYNEITNLNFGKCNNFYLTLLNIPHSLDSWYRPSEDNLLSGQMLFLPLHLIYKFIIFSYYVFI